MSLKQLENHSQLLCGRDSENERLALLIWRLVLITNRVKQNYLKRRDPAPLSQSQNFLFVRSRFLFVSGLFLRLRLDDKGFLSSCGVLLGRHFMTLNLSVMCIPHHKRHWSWVRVSGDTVWGIHQITCHPEHICNLKYRVFTCIQNLLVNMRAFYVNQEAWCLNYKKIHLLW